MKNSFLPSLTLFLLCQDTTVLAGTRGASMVKGQRGSMVRMLEDTVTGTAKSSDAATKSPNNKDAKDTMDVPVMPIADMESPDTATKKPVQEDKNTKESVPDAVATKEPKQEDKVEVDAPTMPSDKQEDTAGAGVDTTTTTEAPKENVDNAVEPPSMSPAEKDTEAKTKTPKETEAPTLPPAMENKPENVVATKNLKSKEDIVTEPPTMSPIVKDSTATKNPKKQGDAGAGVAVDEPQTKTPSAKNSATKSPTKDDKNSDAGPSKGKSTSSVESAEALGDSSAVSFAATTALTVVGIIGTSVGYLVAA